MWKYRWNMCNDVFRFLILNGRQVRLEGSWRWTTNEVESERSFAGEGAESSKQGGMGNFKGRWEGVSGEKEIERM